MDLQFHGANCLTLSTKATRIVVDDNLASLGAKGITKPEDVALFTNEIDSKTPARISFDGPGEYEVSDISIIGIPAKSHMNDKNNLDATMFKLVFGDQSILITGHIYPDLSEGQLEQIGIVDLLVIPIGGNGYTLDPVGALKVIKAVEPKLVIPTHYADKLLSFPIPQQDLEHALKELAMEPKETTTKLRLKPSEMSDVTQLIILEKS